MPDGVRVPASARASEPAGGRRRPAGIRRHTSVPVLVRSDRFSMDLPVHDAAPREPRAAAFTRLLEGRDAPAPLATERGLVST
jgi:hypothetical protein